MNKPVNKPMNHLNRRRRSWATAIFLSCAWFSPVHSAAGEDAGVLYKDYCSVCHGDKGDGRSHASQGLIPPPKDFTAPGQLDRRGMIDIVGDGRPGTAMVGWKTQLSDEQISVVVDFIRSNFMATANPVEDGVGRGIYASTCSVCHGDDGAGAVWGRTSLKPAPLDFTQPGLDKILSRPRMITSVAYGRPGTAMTAFQSQLNATEIAAVVDYIRGAFMQAGPVSDSGITAASTSSQQVIFTAANAEAPLPNGLAGHVDVGRAFYLRNCTACHGVKGDGKGPRAYFIFPKPRNFLDPVTRGRFNRASLFTAIKNGVIGKEMPAWGKVLNDQQIADITEYVYRAFIKPGS